MSCRQSVFISSVSEKLREGAFGHFAHLFHLFATEKGLHLDGNRVNGGRMHGSPFLLRFALAN